MLYKLDVPINHRFRDLAFRRIQLDLIQGRGSADFINSLVEQVPGAWGNFTDRPGIAAHIVAGHKAAIRIRGIGIDQFAVVIDPVSRSGEGRVSLGRTRIRVTLYHMDTEFLQNIAEMDRGSLPALNGDILRGRRHIAVNRDFRYKVSAGKELLFDLPVFPGCHVLIDFIPKNIRTGDVERNPGNNAVLTGLDKFRGTIGFCLDLYEKRYRVTGAGHHGLIAGPAPDQHIVGNRNIFPEFKRHRVHNHILACEGILIAVPCDGDAASGKQIQVNPQVVRIGNGQGINPLFGIPFQFQFRRPVFTGRSKRGNRRMGSHLL